MTVADTLRSTLVYEATATASQLDAGINEMREFDRENVDELVCIIFTKDFRNQ